MSNEIGIPNSNGVEFLSGTDFSSFGSSESECDPDQTQLLNDRNEINNFLKEKTPRISNKVLNFNQFSSDESDSGIFESFSSNNHKNLSNSQDVNITPRTRKAKSLEPKNSSPHIIQAKQQLEKMMKQLESKSAEKSAELEKVNRQLLSHSAELDKYNQEIEEKLSELKRAQSQLYKFASDRYDSSSKNNSLTEEEIKVDIPSKSPNQIFDSHNKDDSNSFRSDNSSQTFSIPVSPTSVRKSDDELIQPGSPDFNNIQTRSIELEPHDDTSEELEKARSQLQQFYDIFNPDFKGKDNLSDEDFEKLLNQAHKDNVLSKALEELLLPTNINEITSQINDLKKKSAELEELRNQLKIANEQLDSKSNELKDIKNKLKNANKQLDNKSSELNEVQNQLKNAGEQLDLKTSDLNQANKKLEDVCKVLESIEGKRINPNQLTKERLSNILQKMKNNNKKANDRKAAQNQSRMKTISSIFNKPDDISDEEFSEMIETMRKNKELSDALQPSLPDDLHNNSNFQDKIQSLEERSALLDKIKEQFSSLLQAVEETNDPINPDDLTDEKLSEIIKNVKKDKRNLSNAAKREQRIRGEALYTSRPPSKKYCEVTRQLAKARDQIAKLIQLSNLNEYNSNQDGLYDEKTVDEIIEKAKQKSYQPQSKIKTRSIRLRKNNNNELPIDESKEREIYKAIKMTLPNHSSCGEEVQVTINILKLRSEELDRITNKNLTPSIVD